jgi:O-methyltransferase involved in polyketide biosynthesis
LTFAPVDFERQTLAGGLAGAGFKTDRSAFFSWLGVVPYLTRDAVMETLAFVSRLPAGSGIVFDYALPPESLSAAHRLVFDALANRVAARGEPFQTFFDPSALAGEIRRMGFTDVEDLGGEEMNARYFAGRSDGLRIGGNLGHLLKARV